MCRESDELRIPDIDPHLFPDLEKVLGYLNFSAGTSDPQMLAAFSNLYEWISEQDLEGATYRLVGEVLRRRLKDLETSSPAFQDSRQAARGLELVFNQALPAYREFHQDLLFHRTEETLFEPFFVGRVCEAVLQQNPLSNEPEKVVEDAVRLLNDYVGHRPVAQLETQKGEPYPHEFVRPIPIFVRGAGVAVGPYREIVEQALQLIEQTQDDLLTAACLDPTLMEEMAIDPRAYDFDHPVNKRQNYHFGQWDPHHLDNQGRYRRYVVQQVTMDALFSRTLEPSDTPRDELIFEASAVLAGTILMSSGISGWGPETHDSTVTLSGLLVHIAAYRDEFYRRLLAGLSGDRAARLQEEASVRRQPFGGARQHLNAQLARCRARQLEHVHVAGVYARMGRADAARRESVVVPSVSARMLSQIECWLNEGHAHVESGHLEEAAGVMPQIMDTLNRAIQCGAVVDPWNILGCDGQFSLFPSAENSVVDHRVDELIGLMEQIFGLYAEIWREAAANDNDAICERIRLELGDTVAWWRQFAVHEVSSIECPDPLETYHAASKVANALSLWQKGGSATADVRFWAPHAEMFDSPTAYALVVEELLKRGDFVASRALLCHWLGQVERVPLEQGQTSFCRLAEHWFLALRDRCRGGDELVQDRPAWKMVRRFFDFLEANADQYWHAPEFTLERAETGDRGVLSAEQHEFEEEDEEDNLFEAAYEEVVYRDSTDDGMEGPIFEEDPASDDALVRESQRLSVRLSFLSTVARLWRLVAVCPEVTSHGQGQAVEGSSASEGGDPSRDALDLHRWIEQATENQRGLLELLRTVHEHHIPIVASDHTSMVEYDRRRMIKESIVERVMSAVVMTADAVRWLRAASAAQADDDAALDFSGAADTADERLLLRAFRDLLRGDPNAFRDAWPDLRETLSQFALLYVPLAKGGEPGVVVATRSRQQALQDLLAWMPRMGLFSECCQLIETARIMERNNAVGPGAVTDFDALFKTGYRAIVESLIECSHGWEWDELQFESRQEALVHSLYRVTESLLSSWLAHSRTLRLSILERLNDRRRWREVVAFIEKYGGELFTQTFLSLGNLRAILHQGPESWLRRLEESEDDALEESLLLQDLERGIPRRDAVEMLGLILEAVAENYGEYRDYNSTTTQSDRGEMLYTLLDFLRLRTRYDRVCWNLKPYVMAHEILSRLHEDEAARIWREAVTERVDEEAQQYLNRLGEMQRNHAMQMPTVADRLAERFIRPMIVDRMRALVEPAMEAGEGDEAFGELEIEVNRLTEEPTGVGLDVPPWLLALEDEVDRARCTPLDRALDSPPLPDAKPFDLTWAEVDEQLEDWSDEA